MCAVTCDRAGASLLSVGPPREAHQILCCCLQVRASGAFYHFTDAPPPHSIFVTGEQASGF